MPFWVLFCDKTQVPPNNVFFLSKMTLYHKIEFVLLILVIRLITLILDLICRVFKNTNKHQFKSE